MLKNSFFWTKQIKILTKSLSNFTKMDEIFTSIGKLKRHIGSPSSSPSPKKRTNFVGITPQKELTNVVTPTNRPFRVSIEGNIGAGKSTLIKYFQDKPGIETFPESIERWRNLKGHNLLDLLYSDMTEWLKVFQNYIQLSRLQTQSTKPSSPSTTVQMFERSIQNNRYCFLEHAYQSGHLHGADYAVLDQWYRWIRDNTDITLDLIVYLRSSPQVAYTRVKARARPEENTLTFKYLQELHDCHERWLMTDDERFNTIPVLVLDADTTMDDILEQYKQNENKILGGEHRVKKTIMVEDNKVKKLLNFD